MKGVIWCCCFRKNIIALSSSGGGTHTHTRLCHAWKQPSHTIVTSTHPCTCICKNCISSCLPSVRRQWECQTQLLALVCNLQRRPCTRLCLKTTTFTHLYTNICNYCAPFLLFFYLACEDSERTTQPLGLVSNLQRHCPHARAPSPCVKTTTPTEHPIRARARSNSTWPAARQRVE